VLGARSSRLARPVRWVAAATMARTLHWRDLRTGAIALGVVIASALVILVFARVGGVRGRKVTLYVQAASATGVLRGTEVRLAGKRVGLVEEVRFLPPNPDTMAKLLIETSVLEDALPLLRRDTYAQIHPGGTIIGAPVVEFSAGSTRFPGIDEGDTIPSRPEVAAEGVAARVGALGHEIAGVSREWRAIRADVRAARGTFGAIRERGPADIGAFRRRTAALMARFTSGRGTIGLATRDDELRRRASSVLAAMDSIGDLLSSRTGNVGRFRRDRTLPTEMDRTRAELTSVRNALAEARGTAGRYREDRALSLELTALGRDFDRLIADVKKNPLRYLAF
jgi:ABC-type transporter Mla subunit MlaD